MTTLGIIVLIAIWTAIVLVLGICIGRMQMHKEMTYKNESPK